MKAPPVTMALIKRAETMRSALAARVTSSTRLAETFRQEDETLFALASLARRIVEPDAETVEKVARAISREYAGVNPGNRETYANSYWPKWTDEARAALAALVSL